MREALIFARIVLRLFSFRSFLSVLTCRNRTPLQPLAEVVCAWCPNSVCVEKSNESKLETLPIVCLGLPIGRLVFIHNQKLCQTHPQPIEGHPPLPLKNGVSS